MILPFKHPFSMLIAGPSYSGKTTFTMELLKNLDCGVDFRNCFATPIPQIIQTCTQVIFFMLAVRYISGFS